jgi:hypothetical protein
MMNNEDLIRANRTEILRIAERHGARNVRVFGSTSTGEETEESDIDFLVDTAEHTSPWFPVSFIQELEDLLGKKSRCRHRGWVLPAVTQTDSQRGKVGMKKEPRVYLAHVSCRHSP